MKLQSDGNGSIIISKGLITVITILLVLISTALSVGLTYGMQQKEVEMIKQDVADMHPIVNSCDTNIAVIGTRLGNIEQNIKEIKVDIKEIRKETAISTD